MRYLTFLITAVLFVAICATAMADTLELADGTLIEGRYVTSSESYFIFETGGEINAFPVNEVVALYLSAGVEKALDAPPAPQPTALTVPAGTPLMITMSETIDSSRHSAGHRFRAQLLGDIVVQGSSVVQSGSYVFGQITQSSQAGRLAGRSEMAIEFTGIMINGQIFPISTTGIQAQNSTGSGAQTVGRTARAAAVGGLIGGRSGARTGARVGAGASILTGGSSINIPRGTMLETTLATPLSIM